MKQITQAKGYIPFDKEIIFDGYKAIGYFPYEKARVRAEKVPRELYKHLEHNVVRDNKVTVIFEDTTRFGTHDFAIFFHDLGAAIGPLDSVTQYDGNPLEY